MSHVRIKPVLLHANIKHAYQPVDPCSLAGAIIVRYLDSIIPIVGIYETRRLMLPTVAQQAICVSPGRTTRKPFFSMT